MSAVRREPEAEANAGAEHEPDYKPECLITLPRGGRGEGTRIVCCRPGKTS